MKSVLVEMLATGDLRGHAVAATGTTIGTSGKVKAAGPNVKPEHARLRLAGAQWVIEPAEGGELLVNGIRRRAVRSLVTGDRLAIGTTNLVFYTMTDEGMLPQRNGFDRARAWLARVIEQTSDDEREYLEALANLEGAIARDENISVLQTAIPLMNDGKWQEALADIEAALAANPNHANARLHRAICLVRVDRIDEAMTEVKRAYELNEDPDVEKEIDGLLERMPHHMVQSAIKHMNAENYRAARAMLEKANAQFPDNAYVQSHLAICWAKDGNYDVARRLVNNAIENADDDERDQVRSIKTQVEQMAAKSTVDRAMAALDYNAQTAVQIFETLPSDVLDIDSIRLMYLVARAKVAVNSFGAAYGSGGKWQIRTELVALASRTDDPDIAATALKIAGQLA